MILRKIITNLHWSPWAHSTGKTEEVLQWKIYTDQHVFFRSRTVCPSPPWLLKTDDDTVNNMWSLLELLTNMERGNETSEIACASKNDPARRAGSWDGSPKKWQVLHFLNFRWPYVKHYVRSRLKSILMWTTRPIAMELFTCLVAKWETNYWR